MESNVLTRWSLAAKLIQLLRTDPEVTRKVACQTLGISSGVATVLLAQCREASLVTEVAATPTGRGRPSTVIYPHPGGPLILAIEVTSTAYRFAISDIFGNYRKWDWFSMPPTLTSIHRLIEPAIKVCDVARNRIRAVSICMSNKFRRDDGRLVFANTGTGQNAPTQTDRDLSLDRDALVLVHKRISLVGMAEARSGAASGYGSALYLSLATELEGTLIVGGTPLLGAHGEAGGYGHVPFGDLSATCSCGARGCWRLSLDGTALAKHRGERAPVDVGTYLQKVASAYADFDSMDIRTRSHFEGMATSLSSGLAGLVNIHDPDVVIIGGAAKILRDINCPAFDDVYQRGLTPAKRRNTPPVLDSALGPDSGLKGAVFAGVDSITSPDSLEKWARSHR